MWKRWWLVLFLLLIGSSVAGQVPASLLITEVYYDTPGDDEVEEWLELANVGTAPIELTDYKVGDEETEGQGEGMARFPEGAIIAPGQTIVIAQSATGFSALFGFLPAYELQDSHPDVPNMRGYLLWASGDMGLANGGDELLLLNGENEAADFMNYGDKTTFFTPAVGGVLRGQSIERVPASCDSDSAADWQPQTSPTPGQLIMDGECTQLAAPQNSPEPVSENQPLDPNQRPTGLPAIGEIQGIRDVAEAVNQRPTFMAVVTGIYADRNAAGTTFYTIFVQDPPGWEDGNPQTSDGIAVFMGTRRPSLVLGDLVQITGQVTEFFGFTEVDDGGLEMEVMGHGTPLPEPVWVDPPADNQEAAAYFEPLEAMRVGIAGQAVAVGSTFSGCSFAVVTESAGTARVVRHQLNDPIGQVIPILHTTDVSCEGFPNIIVGDRIAGIIGPLTYNFDIFRIVQQQPAELVVTSDGLPQPPQPPAPAANQIVIASSNVENFFDLLDDTPNEGEVEPSAAEFAIKQQKIIYTIGTTLGCPTILGIIEVEKAALLEEVAKLLTAQCGFTYQVNHRESADLRGIDTAVLTNPTRITVNTVQLHQGCTPVDTGSEDDSINCPAGQHPLFSRPVLEVSVLADGQPLTVLMNHFKSKSGGEQETEPTRLAQADYLNELVNELLAANPNAYLVAMGDFNDYNRSPVILKLTSGDGQLIDMMQQVPENERYSFIFSGASQLIDGMLVSPALAERVAAVTIVHIDADYPDSLELDTSPEGIPFKMADHDIPYMIVQLDESVEVIAPVETVAAPVDSMSGTEIAGIAGGALVAIALAVAAFIAIRRRKSTE